MIIAILLIPIGFSICEYFYADKIYEFQWHHPEISEGHNPFTIKWWQLRLDLLVLTIGFAIATFKLKKNPKHEKFFEFFVYIGIGLVVSDMIDRWLFNVRIFTLTDVIMTILMLIIGYVKYIKISK